MHFCGAVGGTMAARQHRKNEAYTVCTMAGRKQYADEVLSQLLVRQ